MIVRNNIVLEIYDLEGENVDLKYKTIIAQILDEGI